MLIRMVLWTIRMLMIVEMVIQVGDSVVWKATNIGRVGIMVVKMMKIIFAKLGHHL